MLSALVRISHLSKDKSPYKTHAGAHFQLGGKGVHGPGYYLHLEASTVNEVRGARHDL